MYRHHLRCLTMATAIFFHILYEILKLQTKLFVKPGAQFEEFFLVQAVSLAQLSDIYTVGTR